MKTRPNPIPVNGIVLLIITLLIPVHIFFPLCRQIINQNSSCSVSPNLSSPYAITAPSYADSAITEAIDSGDGKLVSAVLDKDPSIMEKEVKKFEIDGFNYFTKCTPLLYALLKNRQESARILIERGAKVNVVGIKHEI